MILSNTCLIDFIDSKDMREYYKVNKIDLPSDMIYFIIVNAYNKSIYEIINGLRKLKDLFKDSKELCDIDTIKQIDSFITRTNIYLSYFKSTKEGEIYKASFVESESGSEYDELFTSYDNAMEYIKSNSKQFSKNDCQLFQSIQIEKMHFTDVKCEIEDAGESKSYAIAHIDPKSLEIHNIYCTPIVLHTSSEYNDEFLVENPIEDRYYEFPNPFKPGDIVNIIGDFAKDPKSDKVFFISDRISKKHNIPIEDLESGDGGVVIDEYHNGQILWYHVHGLYPMQIEYDTKEYHYDPMNNTPIENGIAQYQRLLRHEVSPIFAIETIIHMFASIHGISADAIM